MSADAKAWQDDESGDWHAIHDGDCAANEEHYGTAYDLLDVLRGVEACMQRSSMRWMLFIYTDGRAGLKGYTW